jgi:hypothetical protein
VNRDGQPGFESCSQHADRLIELPEVAQPL